MSKSSYTATVSVGPSGVLALLTILFVYLKVTSQVTWSWATVLAPVWAPVVFVLAMWALVFAAVGLAHVFRLDR